MQWKGKYVRMI